MTELKESFDGVAQEYDRYRSSYDNRVIDDIKNISFLNDKGVVCEIGAGTGQASVSFTDVERLVCVEPGHSLSAILKQNMSAYNNVEILTDTFEKAPLSSNRFDLVFAAQSFHWVDSQIRYKKTSAILKPEGWFAAFWKRWIPDGSEPFASGTKLFQEYLPGYTARSPQQHEDDALSDISELINCGFFKGCQLRRYPYTETPINRTAQERAESLRTWSMIAALEKNKQNELIERLTEIFVNEPDKTTANETVLIIGQKRG